MPFLILWPTKGNKHSPSCMQRFFSLMALMSCRQCFKIRVPTHMPETPRHRTTSIVLRTLGRRAPLTSKHAMLQVSSLLVAVAAVYDAAPSSDRVASRLDSPVLPGLAPRSRRHSPQMRVSKKQGLLIWTRMLQIDL